MILEERVVLPGDIVASADEYISGEGAYDDSQGNLRASVVGRPGFDKKERIARVGARNAPRLLKKGDIVVGRVEDIRNKLVFIEVAAVRGSDRAITGPKRVSLHISKLAAEFLNDFSGKLRIGDIVRGEVIQVEPHLQIATVGDDLGVISSQCPKCGSSLKRKGPGSLSCEECELEWSKKLAKDYGEGNI